MSLAVQARGKGKPGSGHYIYLGSGPENRMQIGRVCMHGAEREHCGLGEGGLLGDGVREWTLVSSDRQEGGSMSAQSASAKDRVHKTV